MEPNAQGQVRQRRRAGSIRWGRRGALVALLLLSGLIAAQPATATIVWSKGGDVWAMNDDGSGQRLLIPKSAAPGMDALRDPTTAPSGSTVFFTGETTRNKVMRTGLCGAFPFYPCTTTHYGFYSSGTYRWSGGSAQRLSPEPAYCFNCTDGTSEPEARADGSYVGAFTHCQGFLDDGTYDCVGSILSSDGAQYPAACNGETLAGDLPTGPSPSPSAPGVLVYAGCGAGGQPSALILTGPNRAGERIIACDDATQEDPSWSPSGDQVVAAEGGTEAGLWIYGSGAANNGCFTGQLREVVGAPPGVAFSDPRFVGSDRLVFAVAGDLWTVPTSCSSCAFPAAATRLTSDGDNASPSWTSNPLVVPGPPPPSAPPAPSSPSPKATDKTAPKLAFGQKKRQRLPRQGFAIVLQLRADEDCDLTVTGNVVVPGKDASLRKVTRSLDAGKSATIRMKLTSKALRAVKRTWRRHGTPAAQVRILAKDAGGNRTTKSQRIVLLR